jgi:hypothetical protein
MKNIHRTVVVCLLTALILISVSACKKREPAAPPPTPEQKAAIEEMKKNAEEARKVFAAKVNGVEITMHDLVREMNRVTPKYVKGDEKIPAATAAKIKKEALDNLIFNELAVQEAARQGLTVNREQIDEVVKLMKEQMGSRDAYQQYLDNLGINEEGLKKRIERSHLFEMVTAKEVYHKIAIDEQEMRAEYEKNKSAYKAGDRQLSYEEASAAIKRKMTSERGAVRKKEWGAALRKTAMVEITKEAK